MTNCLGSTTYGVDRGEFLHLYNLYAALLTRILRLYDDAKQSILIDDGRVIYLCTPS